jgi:hypothetical protein
VHFFILLYFVIRLESIWESPLSGRDSSLIEISGKWTVSTNCKFIIKRNYRNKMSGLSHDDFINRTEADCCYIIFFASDIPLYSLRAPNVDRFGSKLTIEANLLHFNAHCDWQSGFFVWNRIIIMKIVIPTILYLAVLLLLLLLLLLLYTLFRSRFIDCSNSARWCNS